MGTLRAVEMSGEEVGRLESMRTDQNQVVMEECTCWLSKLADKLVRVEPRLADPGKRQRWISKVSHKVTALLPPVSICATNQQDNIDDLLIVSAHKHNIFVLADVVQLMGRAADAEVVMKALADSRHTIEDCDAAPLGTPSKEAAHVVADLLRLPAHCTEGAGLDSVRVFRDKSAVGDYFVEVHRVTDGQDESLELRFEDDIPGNEPSVQSAVPQGMLCSSPNFSAVDGYCKTMLLALTYYPPAQLPRAGWKALVVGLGGGILPRFLLNTFGGCCVDVVELDPVVVSVAQTFFGCGPHLAADGTERLTLHAADGKQFILDMATKQQSVYDMIFIDAFDNDGVPSQFLTQDLVDASEQLLKPAGCFVVNTWVVHDLVSYGAMRKCLSCMPQLESYTTSDRLNRVVIAQKGPAQNVTDVETTQLLQQQTGIPFAQVRLVELEQRLPRVSGRQR